MVYIEALYPTRRMNKLLGHGILFCHYTRHCVIEELDAHYKRWYEEHFHHEDSTELICRSVMPIFDFDRKNVFDAAGYQRHFAGRGTAGLYISVTVLAVFFIFLFVGYCCCCFCRFFVWFFCSCCVCCRFCQSSCCVGFFFGFMAF